MDSRREDMLLEEQLAYYRARALEYDQWFARVGRYDRGEEANRRWFAAMAAAESSLDAFDTRGEVLELACGTGLWTRHLIRNADRVVAVDAAPEMLERNRRRLVGTSHVDHVLADLFEWEPNRLFDCVVFAFWLSHVPPARFERFWELVGSWLKPAGRVFFVDSLYTEASTAVDHELAGPGATTVLRRLNDGREYRIVKVFHRPDELQARLTSLGWDVRVRGIGELLLCGSGGLQHRTRGRA